MAVAGVGVIGLRRRFEKGGADAGSELVNEARPAVGAHRHQRRKDGRRRQ